MLKIRTVTGDIRPEELKVCQCHEHLFIEKGRSFEVNPALFMDDAQAAAKELMLYKAAGGSAVVDAQPAGAGSMPRRLKEASAAAGVFIIASTGFHRRIFYPENHFIHTLGPYELADRFIADFCEGITEGDGGIPQNRCCIRAGVIKCALDEKGLDAYAKRLFEAAAAAHRITGMPLLVHTENGRHALLLVRTLKDMGVPEKSIILCHIERGLDDMEEKLKIARTGVYLECDTIARPHCHSDEAEALFIRRLCEDGHGDRILLGLDTTRGRMKSYGGSTGLDYLLHTFRPLLLKTGVSEEAVHKMLVSNPARALAVKIQ